jgi:hypothetical protein
MRSSRSTKRGSPELASECSDRVLWRKLFEVLRHDLVEHRVLGCAAAPERRIRFVHTG